MHPVVLLAAGLTAGLHGALYGAYKDSPHESFMPRRFAREVVLALIVSAGLPPVSPIAIEQSAFTIYLSVFALVRIATSADRTLHELVRPSRTAERPLRSDLAGLSRAVQSPELVVRHLKRGMPCGCRGPF